MGSRLVPVQVFGLPERLASQVLLDWNVPWRLPGSGSYQAKVRTKVGWYSFRNPFGATIAVVAKAYGFQQWQRPVVFRLGTSKVGLRVPRIYKILQMACSLPYTDSEIEALVQRLISEDKGRQDVRLNLAFQFDDSCAVKDDFRKAYEKCNDISQESRKYSSQTDFPLTEKELHQLRMDEEALKEMLEEEAMNKKAQEEKIWQEQAKNDAFFLEFGVVSTPALSISYPYLQYCDLTLGSCERILSSSLAVTSSGLSFDVSDVGLPSEKVMTSGKNGDDGDLLLFRDGPSACDISEGTLRFLVRLGNLLAIISGILMLRPKPVTGKCGGILGQ
ncbi:hypothetical protein Tco_0927917 [Tanacetum coccineum]